MDKEAKEETTRARARSSRLEEKGRMDEHKRSPIEVTKRQRREPDQEFNIRVGWYPGN